MICYDSGFPEVTRILALKGPEIIFQPSARSLQDRDTWDINTRSRALENCIFLLGVNRSRAEGALRLFRDNCVVNPRGEVMITAGDCRSGLS
jgi:predicted amidohydrolase